MRLLARTNQRERFANSLRKVHSSPPNYNLARTSLSNKSVECLKEEIIFDISSKTVLTREHFREKVDNLATQFYIRGWKQDHVICLFMPDCLICYTTAYAAGRIEIPLTIANPNYKAQALAHQITQTKAKYIITTHQLLPIVKEVMASTRYITEVLILDKKNEFDPLKDLDNKDKTWCYYTQFKYDLLLRPPPEWGKLPNWNNNTNQNLLSFSHFDEQNDKLSLTEYTHSQVRDLANNLNKIINLNFKDIALSLVPGDDVRGLAVFNLVLDTGAKIVQNVPLELDSIKKFISEHKINVLFFTLNAKYKDEIFDDLDLDISHDTRQKLKTKNDDSVATFRVKAHKENRE